MAESPPDRDRLRRLTERLDVAAQRAEQLLSDSVLAAATAQPSDHLSPDPAWPEPDATARPTGSEPGVPNARPGDPDRDPLRVADSEPQPPPPSGWRDPPLDDRSGRERWLDSDELELLMTVLAAVRDRIPPDLRRRLRDAVRELLMALRALLDWYLERTDRPPHGRTDVEDIPII